MGKMIFGEANPWGSSEGQARPALNMDWSSRTTGSRSNAHTCGYSGVTLAAYLCILYELGSKYYI